MTMFDIAVIGGGPAGMSAAILGASFGYKVVLIEKNRLGGQCRASRMIENVVGLPFITGEQYAMAGLEQLDKFGVQITRGEVVDLVNAQGIGSDAKVLTLQTGQNIIARSVVVACGLAHNRIGVPGEDLIGVEHGTTDGDYRDAFVTVVGGGNSAGQAALHAATEGYVILLARRPLRETMAAYLVDRIERQSRIAVRTDATVREFYGENGRLWGVHWDGRDVQHVTDLADHALVFIGNAPDTDWLTSACACDGNGRIMCNGQHQTSMAGVFVAGDARKGSTWGIATAAGEGSAAVQQAFKYLRGQA